MVTGGSGFREVIMFIGLIMVGFRQSLVHGLTGTGTDGAELNVGMLSAREYAISGYHSETCIWLPHNDHTACMFLLLQYVGHCFILDRRGLL